MLPEQCNVDFCLKLGLMLCPQQIPIIKDAVFSELNQVGRRDAVPFGSIDCGTCRDSIPSPELIEARKECILDYWDLLRTKHETQFQAEINVALLGKHDSADWKNTAINRLKSTSHYLIEKRGFAEWNHGK